MSPAAMKPVEAHKTTAKRPNYVDAAESDFTSNVVRDQFTPPTWLALGAAVQAALFTLPIKPYYAASPVVAYLLWEVMGTLLIVVGLRADPLKAKALAGKYTAIVPDEEGNVRMGSQGEKVSLFFLGFRNHHHLGMLAPGFLEMANYADKMFRELEERADEFGFLGQSRYASTGNTNRNAEIMSIMYFKSNADVARFATSALHREGWDWFLRITKKWPHIGIMHELYEVPAGSWESVYLNIEPTLLAATKHKVIDDEGNEVWASPNVDASRGKASNHLGRMQ